MTSITLRDITRDNWLHCIDLQVADSQKNFVAPNTFSLVEAIYEAQDQWQPQAIYADDTMVGFIMYGQPTQSELGGRVWEICRLMVDKSHQQKGYGRAAMIEAIRRMSALPNCAAIYISFHQDNAVAEKLYTSLGFESTGLILYDEVVMRLRVKK